MWIETLRIGFIAIGGLLALALFAGPRLASRFYAAALLAAGGGHRSKPTRSGH